jgi:hypothetical protein
MKEEFGMIKVWRVGLIAAVLVAGLSACGSPEGTGGNNSKDNTGWPLTGTVSILGDAEVGLPLWVDTGDLVGYEEISYQWQRGDTANGAFADITGATGSQYMLVAEDAGKYLRVVVSRAGYNGTVVSAAVGPVAAAITWTAVADGELDVTTSTAITFTFSEAVSGLTAGDISVTPASGIVTSGTLTESGTDGTEWTLPLSAVGTSAVLVKITKSGITRGAQTVTVHRAVVTLDGLDEYLDELSDEEEEEPPATVFLASTIDVSSSDWEAVNSAIETAKKYVVLDLSACTATDNTISGKNSPDGNDFNRIYNNTYIKGIILPSTLTSIGKHAFSGCYILTSVIIPDSVESIGEYAFNACTRLASVTLPAGVESIGEHAFYHCTSLTSVTLPAGVTSIGGSAFACWRALACVTLPAGVESIGEHAFYACNNLTSVTLPDSVESIGGHAFEHCTGLTSVTLPAGVESIGEGAFNGCTGLTSVTFEGSSVGLGDDDNPAFLGDLKEKYESGGAGTYTRTGSGEDNSPYTWTKTTS